MPGRKAPAQPKETDEAAASVARRIQETKALMTQGRYSEASAGLKEVLKSAPADPEARQLAVQLSGYEKKHADDALGQMTASKQKADEAAAIQYASKSFEAAQTREAAARAEYGAQHYDNAAAGFFEAIWSKAP